MKSSEDKQKPPEPASSDFAEVAIKAMRKAQLVAEKENARFGMRLILEKPRRSAKL